MATTATKSRRRARPKKPPTETVTETVTPSEAMTRAIGGEEYEPAGAMEQLDRPVDFLAWGSEDCAPAHYIDHIAPVWWALPPDRRGTLYVRAGRTLERYAAARVPDVRPLADGDVPEGEACPLAVCSYGDLELAASWPERPLIYLDHGIGQRYTGSRAPCFSAPDARGARSRVGLFLAANKTAAGHIKATYPDAPVAVCGLPKLDAWVNMPRPKPWPYVPCTVGLSFRWRCDWCPEAGSAWDHYAEGLAAVATELSGPGWRLLGHAHPRMQDELFPLYDILGIECVPRFEDVVRQAHVYCADNSSTLFEAAFVMPVVVLNAPWYRRDVDHGGRFWEWAGVGVQCEGPEDLVAAIGNARMDADRRRRRRLGVVRQVLPFIGQAGARAAGAIEAYCQGDMSWDG